jgi:hypothetical protein
MGEMTEVQMICRQRENDLAAERQSQKPDILSAIVAGCVIVPVLVVFTLLYGLTLLVKALLLPVRLFHKRRRFRDVVIRETRDY